LKDIDYQHNSYLAQLEQGGWICDYFELYQQGDVWWNWRSWIVSANKLNAYNTSLKAIFRDKPPAAAGLSAFQCLGLWNGEAD